MKKKLYGQRVGAKCLPGMTRQPNVPVIVFLCTLFFFTATTIKYFFYGFYVLQAATCVEKPAIAYTVRHNYNLKSHKYVCITTYQPDTKSDPNPNRNPNPKQHAIVNIQLNIVTCPMYRDKFIRNNVVASSVLL